MWEFSATVDLSGHIDPVIDLLRIEKRLYGEMRASGLVNSAEFFDALGYREILETKGARIRPYIQAGAEVWKKETYSFLEPSKERWAVFRLDYKTVGGIAEYSMNGHGHPDVMMSLISNLEDILKPFSAQYQLTVSGDGGISSYFLE